MTDNELKFFDPETGAELHRTPDPYLQLKPFRHPCISGKAECPECGHPFEMHGWLDKGSHGNTVCPFDFTPTEPEAPPLPYVVRKAKAQGWDEGHYMSDLTWRHIYDGHDCSEGEVCPTCCQPNPYRAERIESQDNERIKHDLQH